MTTHTSLPTGSLSSWILTSSWKLAASRILTASMILSAALIAAAGQPLSASEPSAASQQSATVELKPVTDTTLEILIGGQPFATFNYGSDLPKPFLLPIRSASGVVLNRALDDKSDADHPHHKGLWVSIDEVNEFKFWAERSPIVNVAVRPLKSGTEAAVLEVENEWRGGPEQPAVIVETTRITIHASRLLVYDITFTAAQEEVVFEDTKEGLLGFRVAPSMKEKNGGQIISSDGSRGSKDCWGKTFAWIDYSGMADGRMVGVTLMDHPDNFRASRYHVRDYGLFSISPFGENSYTNGALEAQPLHLKDGDSVRLRYGVYLHDGDASAANIDEAYQLFQKLAIESDPNA